MARSLFITRSHMSGIDLFAGHITPPAYFRRKKAIWLSASRVAVFYFLSSSGHQMLTTPPPFYFAYQLAFISWPVCQSSPLLDAGQSCLSSTFYHFTSRQVR